MPRSKVDATGAPKGPTILLRRAALALLLVGAAAFAATSCGDEKPGRIPGSIGGGGGGGIGGGGGGGGGGGTGTGTGTGTGGGIADGGTLCANSCDCPQGQRCGPTSRCAVTNPPVYCCSNAGCPTGSNCIDAFNTQSRCGAGTGRTCLTLCDCEQGQVCRNNECATVANPAYCCTKTGCPTGAACQNAAGEGSRCQ